MELIDYVRMLGRRWAWWVTMLVLGTGLAVAYVHVAHKAYTATTEEYVASVVPANGNTGDYLASRSTIIASMASYPALVKSPSVIQGVLQDLPGVKLTAAQLAGRLSAAYVPRTVVLKVSAVSSKPQIAAELSTAAAKRLAIAVQDLETTNAGGHSRVRVVVTRPAAVPGSPSSPNKTLDIALGVMVGLGLGLISASLRDQAKRPRAGAMTVAAGTTGAGPTAATTVLPMAGAATVLPSVPAPKSPVLPSRDAFDADESTAWAGSTVVSSNGHVPARDADGTPPTGHSRF